MNFNGQNSAGYISIAQRNIASKLVIFRVFVKNTKLVLLGKRFRVTIGLGNNKDEDKAL